MKIEFDQYFVCNRCGGPNFRVIVNFEQNYIVVRCNHCLQEINITRFVNYTTKQGKYENRIVPSQN